MQSVKRYEGRSSVIIHGDCVRALPTIPDSAVDLIFADPPYNIGKPVRGIQGRVALRRCLCGVVLQLAGAMSR